jgi:hypothetical protein
MMLARELMPRTGVHGFRFVTNFPREICEMPLAHMLENRIEVAYRRGDLFEKRREHRH